MNSDYTNYTADDFISNEYFLQWSRFPDEGSNKFWLHWIAQNPGKEPEVRAALSFIHDLQIKTTVPAEEQIELSLKKNLATIEQIEQTGTRRKKGIVRSIAFRWVVAASFFICCGLAAWFYFNEEPVTFEMATGNGEIKTVILPDSSVVILNANSSLSYSADMARMHTREVRLEGEGFFTVKHIEPANGAVQRFIVHSGELDVEVLGTTFNVKKKATFTNVSLNTGSIKIEVKDHPEAAVFLQPGDFIQYAAAQKHIIRKKVKAELYSVWKEEKLVLDKMPLSAIAQLIEDAFGHKVNITDGRLALSKVSGSLYMKDEATILETLAFALNINISKQGDVLIFQPKSNIKN